MKVGLLVLSDIHAGSTTGLCTKKPVQLEDGGWYEPSLFQNFLYDSYVSCLDEADDILGGTDYRLLIGNGDMIDGNHHGTTQICSPSPAIHIKLALDLLAPVFGIGFDAAVFTKGTATHVGHGGSGDNTIAKALSKDGFPVEWEPGTGQAAWYYWHGELGGVKIDAAHHGRVGSRPWTKPNVTMNLARQIWAGYVERGERPPDISIRSHRHDFIDTANAQPTRVIQTASFQMPTEFIHKIAAGDLLDVGMVAIIIDTEAKYEADRIRVYPILRQAKRGKTWRPKK